VNNSGRFSAASALVDLERLPTFLRSTASNPKKIGSDLFILFRRRDTGVAAAFRKYAKGNGFRLVHFSVQPDHLHLMVEADGKAMLSRGMQKLVISISRRLNLLWGEGKRWLGRLLRERYHAHVLKTLSEARHAWVYVMHNAVKHSVIVPGICDPYSSAVYFDGYASSPRRIGALLIDPSMLAKAASWLLTKSASRCEA
jgi:REP element-mobilizing transposase RayT